MGEASAGKTQLAIQLAINVVCCFDCKCVGHSSLQGAWSEREGAVYRDGILLSVLATGGNVNLLLRSIHSIDPFVEEAPCVFSEQHHGEHLRGICAHI